jgi:hypothetical protein
MKQFRLLLILFFLSSCIVQSPEYTTIERALSLELGMTKEQVEEWLDLTPHNLKAYTDTSNVYIYIYRTNERKTLSFYTKRKNGKKTIGKYMQLEVAYSKKDNKVIHIESCNDCPDNLTTTSKVNINIEKVMTFISVTLPVILVYIGLRSE